MRIAFFGTSEFVGSVQHARFLRRLIRGGVRPAVVVTTPDTPSGRGRHPIPLAVKSAALESGIPVLQPPSLKGFSEELARHEVELSLVAAYGKILPPEVLAVPKSGSLNVHPSLLPRWRGPTPIQATILAGDSLTGVTIIQMDEHMDHGSIVAQREFPLALRRLEGLAGRVWTAPLLSDALTDLGVELFLEILEPWVLGKIAPKPQDHEAATYSRILEREDGRIDWLRPAEEIERMIRAFQPWPGAFTFWKKPEGELRLTIDSAGSVSDERAGGRVPGEVLEQGGELAIATGNGLLVVERLTPAGRATMSGSAFLRGQRSIIGAVLR